MDRINGLTRFIPIQMREKDVVGIVTFDLAPVVQKVDSAIHRINHYPLDSAILLVSLILMHWMVIYPVDSAIHRINHYPLDSAILLVSLILMHWMVIYPVDSAIQLFNNSGKIGLLPTNHIIAAYYNNGL